ncbi:MAG: hypothetical protein WDN24_16920 [Sphingomonas sp.]
MITIGLSLALLAAHVAPDPVRVGAWLVGPLDDASCQAETHFGGNYLVNISEDATGRGLFVFGDDRWLLKDGDTKPATLSWDGWKTTAEASFAAVRTDNGSSYLVMETDAGFTENLAGAKHLWLRIPGVDFDDDLDIPDAPDLVTAIAACNGNH